MISDGDSLLIFWIALGFFTHPLNPPPPSAREGESLDCHDLLKGKFRNDDLEAIRRLSRFAIRKDSQNTFFCK